MKKVSMDEGDEEKNEWKEICVDKRYEDEWMWWV